MQYSAYGLGILSLHVEGDYVGTEADLWLTRRFVPTRREAQDAYNVATRVRLSV